MKFRVLLPLLAAIGIGTLLLLPADAFAQPLDISALDSHCLATELKNCTVLISGRINSDGGDPEGAPQLAWQTQAGFTDEDGVLGGFVLLQHDGDGWTLLDSGFEGYRYAPPRLGVDGVTLHVPGYRAGTGSYNADRLYVFGDTGAAVYREDWQRIDIDFWQRYIGEMLPKKLEIWKGVDYDFGDWFYGDLTARTPLWRPDDGNCCPTGGWATIHFEIDYDAKRLVATSVDHTPSGD